ncbi:MAG TPA: PAS domain S-box protein [Acetobacteraceae bacterium]|nr:PAS domain S-box protein [Acetobacteraceae bacterium]
MTVGEPPQSEEEGAEPALADGVAHARVDFRALFEEAERAHRETERRLNAVLDNATVAIFLVDSHMHCTYMNAAAEKLTGYALPEIRGRALHDVLHHTRPDGSPYPLAECPIHRALPERSGTRGEEVFVHKDGHFYPVAFSASPIRDEASRATGTIIEVRDITLERRREAALRELTDHLEAQIAERTRERDDIWNLSHDPFLIADGDGRWLRASPAWTTLLGWSEQELLGRTSDWLVHPDDRARTRAEVERLGAGGTTLRFENRLRARNGEYRWFSWNAVPRHGLTYCVARDVTAEKEQQEVLRHAEEALRQAAKMEAIGQLTGGIAHDFNNLLTGISGNLELMRVRLAQGRLDALDRYINAASVSAQRAATLTHRLLAFARRQPLDPKPVDANRLVRSMEEMLRRTLGEAIRVEIVTAGGLWLTFCDPHQLESGLLNLALNARDAMPDGGTLTIETGNAHLDHAYAARQRDIEPGQYVCIAVTDTGTGMAQEVAGRAFEPFFTTKPFGAGTGLGLSMLYGFARQSKGFCKIYSEPGQGTTVKLYLPRLRAIDSPDRGISKTIEALRAEHRRTVLVVEDEPVVRALVLDVLDELGHRAMEAADGPSALSILQSAEPIDLLVTDVGLPGINGWELAKKARERRPELKTLFMTGYAENATVANGFLQPGMELMTKPFALDALASRLRSILDQASNPPSR